MIGQGFAVLLAVGASLGGLYGGTMMALDAAGDGEAGHDAQAAGGILRTELTATPLVTGTSIHGYIIGRYVVSYDTAIRAGRNLPLETLIGHAVNGFFYGNASDTFWLDGPLDMNAIAEGLKASINEAAGAPVVTALAVRQLDYLKAPEIRQPVISFDR